MEKTILLSPENSAVVSTHTARQDRFIGTERYTWEEPDDWEASFEIKPVSFDFLSEEETNLLEISENKDFTESVSLSVKGQHTDVYNLKTGTRYYWRVNNSEPFSFRVKSGIRFLKVEGFNNARDLGGYKTDDGRRVKQGMIIRAEAPETFREGKLSQVKLRPGGIMTFVNELGIKTDVDLRSYGELCPGFKGLLYGYGTAYRHFPIAAYHWLADSKESRELVKKIYETVLTDETAYPLYIHCLGGADRTGTLCASILAFLGVGKEEILCDYEVTLLAAQKRWRDQNKGYVDELMKRIAGWEGNTLKEKFRYFLTVQCGIGEETLAKIEELLLESDDPD